MWYAKHNKYMLKSCEKMEPVIQVLSYNVTVIVIINRAVIIHNRRYRIKQSGVKCIRLIYAVPFFNLLENRKKDAWKVTIYNILKTGVNTCSIK